MKKLYGLLFFLILCLFRFSITLSAQTWEQYIGTEMWEEGGAIATTKDKGFIVAGRQEAQVYVRRMDQDGALLWENTYLGENPPKEDIAFAIIQTLDGGFALTGQMGLSDALNFDVFLLKIDANGEQEWIRSFGGPDKDVGYSLAQTEDQGFIVAGAYGITFENDADQTLTSSMYLIKTNATGTTDWIKRYGDTLDDYATSVIPLPNGDFAVHGIKGVPERGVEYAYLRVEASGDSLWTKTYGTALDDDWATSAISTGDGGFLQTGYTFGTGTYLIRYQENGDTLWTQHYGASNTFFQDIALGENGIIYNLSTNLDADEDFILTAIDVSNGEELWSKEIGKSTQNERSVAITTATDKGIVLLGSANRFDQLDLVLVKTNEEGNSLNFHAIGEVFIDEMPDCSSTDGIPLKDWLIEAKGANTYYTYTDENGQYDLLLDIGTYEVRVIPASDYWQPCVEEVIVEATDFGETIINFGVKKEERCPYLLVDISTPFLQPCATTIYTISYENKGTNDAVNPVIELTFPTELEVLSSSLLWQQAGKFYTFLTEETLAPFEKRTFQVEAFLDCEVVLGATHTVKAHIFPDALCTLPNEAWNEASLEVQATCQEESDSVELVIKNVGEDMDSAAAFTVIEDLVILKQGQVDLEKNDSLRLLFPANGKTYRVEAQQARWHPGNSRPAISIEGCTTDNTEISLGFVTQFYEDDGNAFISIDAQENLETLANNRLIAAPKGIGIDRLIDPKEDIEYQISFPIFKIGEDSLMRLVIRDSLSEYVDLTTFQAGTSSHEYRVELTETGILKFVFEDIIVPAQDTIYGFVKFRIGQKASNQEGLLIENKVGFYRDYELPERYFAYQHNTAKIVLEVNESTDVETIELDQQAIMIYPNPVQKQLAISCYHQVNCLTSIQLYTANGQLIMASGLKEAQEDFQLDFQELPNGLYSLLIATEKGVQYEKILVLR